MQTKILKIECVSQHAAIKTAAELLKNNEVVAIPTETVYGLGANALNPQAVKKIFLAKGRPQDNPLIVHISSMDELYPLVKKVPETAKILAEKFWPGPLTIILKKSARIPDAVSAGLDTVAIRMPSHEIAHAIIACAGVPIAAPSANISGSPSPTNAQSVYHDMNGKIPLIVDGGECDFGVESTVITLAGKTPRLLRPGGITLEKLREVLGDVEVDNGVLSKVDEHARVASPGMKYKHYAPKIKVVILKGSLEKYCDYIKNHSENAVAFCFENDKIFVPIKCVTYGDEHDPLSQARQLFESLRKLDDTGASIAYAHCPDTNGIGLAVYNRLLRSAAFDVIDLE